MANPGPAIGDKAPEFGGVDIRGRPMRIGGKQDKHTLVIFVSATCSSCAELGPALKSIGKSERKTLRVVMVGLMGSEEENRRFVTQHKLEKIPFVISRDLGLTYRIGTPPYAVMIDREGVVKAKGVVNHLEHLESLINAAEIAEEKPHSPLPDEAAQAALAINEGSRT